MQMIVAALLCLALQAVASDIVTYDHRAIVINGQRKLLIGGCIHYPRSTPEMWPALLKQAKEGGVDVLETYVFWNLHEPVRGVYDYSGNNDVVQFLTEAQKAGLYVILRPGPYVCAEWNYGGLPVWLKEIPNMVFRTNNAPWLNEMRRWMDHILTYMRQAKMFADQGGPVIITQIENEYGNIMDFYGQPGKEYVHWCGSYAMNSSLQVPWIMCQQADAPVGVINTCNGYYCDGFESNKPGTPNLWTENWPGWFQQWGSPVPHRPVQDIAFAVARFIARGGSLPVYYMYHGGTNFGRTVGGPFIITSYDYDVHLDEYGLPQEPKYSHSAQLHRFLHEFADIIMENEVPKPITLGLGVEAHVYGTLPLEGANSTGNSNAVRCVAFLSNTNWVGAAVDVIFNGRHFSIPRWSVTLLRDCTTQVFNTAHITAPTAVNSFTSLTAPQREEEQEQNEQAPPRRSEFAVASAPVETVKMGADEMEQRWAASSAAGAKRHTRPQFKFSSITAPKFDADVRAGNAWPFEWVPEDVPQWSALTSNTPLEHIRLVGDTSDYLWYLANYSSPFAADAELHMDNVQDLVHVFVNDRYVATEAGGSPRVRVHIQAGMNHIQLLVLTQGLLHYGPYQETYKRGLMAGLTGQYVTISGIDISKRAWAHVVGLRGETLRLHTEEGASQVQWNTNSTRAVGRPLTWWKTRFDLPRELLIDGTLPAALELNGMTKGYVFVNGHNLGRYWNLRANKTLHICDACDYAGPYIPERCLTGCDALSQQFYHVPRSWLRPYGNLLVMFEEIGGQPAGVSLVARQRDTVCGVVGEHYPAEDLFVSLSCTNPGSTAVRTITSVEFASFGNPHGNCRAFTQGSCHAAASKAVVEQYCLGKPACEIPTAKRIFGNDPCPLVSKQLAVQVRCG